MRLFHNKGKKLKARTALNGLCSKVEVVFYEVQVCALIVLAVLKMGYFKIDIPTRFFLYGQLNH